MTQAERLNNAIVRLDWINSGNAEAAELAHDWVSWWNGARHVLPEGSALWWAVLEYYWARYRAAYERASHREGLSRPEEVDPTLTETAREDLVRRFEAVKDAGQSAERWVDQRINDFASKARPSMLPLGVALGAFGMLTALLLMRKAAS